MASIWSRNKIWGGDFNTDVNVDDNTNNASKVPTSSFFGFKFSSFIDATLNRSSWLTTVLAQSMRSSVFKEEDRATGSNIGVSGTSIEPTQTVYVTPEQLPDTTNGTNDFTVSAVETDGDLTSSLELLEAQVVNTNRKNKQFKIRFSVSGVKWLLARTYSLTDLKSVINGILTNPTDGTGLLPVGIEMDYPSLLDPEGFLNLCNGTRTIAKSGASVGTLKDDKYKNLFIFLYTNYSDALCPVSTGRAGTGSVNALIDWNAGKNIQIPDYRGKVAGYYKASDSNFGEIGKEFGSETISGNQLPQTAPWGITSTVTGGTRGFPSGNSTFTVDGTPNEVPSQAGLTNIIVTSSINNNPLGGEKHFQPTKITSRIIKY